MFIEYRKTRDTLRPHDKGTPTITQVAALCYRIDNDEVDILLITSSNGRWILPKGWSMDHLSDAEAAQEEAWEEAGVRPKALDQTALGSYVNVKDFDNGATALCETTVFAIEVDALADSFPEDGKRKRKWVKLNDAAEAVDDADLAVFLQSLRAEV